MLFLYEKWFQIPSDALLKNLKNRNNVVKEYKEDNLLWPNALDDDVIVSSLRDVYSSLEKNYVSRAQALHHQRKAAAHVSEIRADKISVDNYLKEMLVLFDKIQQCHSKYLSQLNHRDMAGVQSSYRLSVQDIRYLVGMLISDLSKSSSFKESKEIWMNISTIRQLMLPIQIEATLDAIMENSRGATYHQILEAGNCHEFIKQLYELNNEPSEKWRQFAEYLRTELVRLQAQNKLSNYLWLFENFDIEIEAINDEPTDIDLDSIIF